MTSKLKEKSVNQYWSCTLEYEIVNKTKILKNNIKLVNWH